MSNFVVTPPAGFQLEQGDAGAVKPPAGFQLEQNADARRVTPPAGFQLEQSTSKARVTPPAGFKLEQPARVQPPAGFQLETPLLLPRATPRPKPAAANQSSFRSGRGVAQKNNQSDSNAATLDEFENF